MGMTKLIKIKFKLSDLKDEDKRVKVLPKGERQIQVIYCPLMQALLKQEKRTIYAYKTK